MMTMVDVVRPPASAGGLTLISTTRSDCVSVGVVASTGTPRLEVSESGLEATSVSAAPETCERVEVAVVDDAGMMRLTSTSMLPALTVIWM